MKSKKIKLIIPVVIIALSIGYLLLSSTNMTVEDTINDYADTGSMSHVENMISEIQNDNGNILCVFETEANGFGYATLKDNKRNYNNYSVCTIGNIDDKLIKDGELVMERYDKQKTDFVYGVIVNPDDTTVTYNGKSYELSIVNYKNYKIGIFIE